MLKPEDIVIESFHRPEGFFSRNVVRITHKPTGISVEYGKERSAHANKIFAMQELEYQLKEMAHAEKPTSGKLCEVARSEYHKTSLSVDMANRIEQLEAEVKVHRKSTEAWMDRFSESDKARYTLEAELAKTVKLLNEANIQIEDLMTEIKEHVNALDDQMVSTHIGVFDRGDNPKDAIKQLMEWSQSVGEYFEKEKLEVCRLAMVRATIGSCSCLTKTPEPEYHAKYCGYRILREALEQTK